MTKMRFCFMALTVLAVALLTLASLCPSCGDKHESGKMGFALAIGLNRVDPGHYSGWAGELSGCEPDARDMEAIAKSRGFVTETLLTREATRKNVRKKLVCLADRLKSGDLLVVSFSGHGGQVPDMNGDEEDDDLDETWCLYDGELLDDELFEFWMKFQPGVRILVFSDSCHSGTVLKMKKPDFENPDQNRIDMITDEWLKLRKSPKLKKSEILSIVKNNRIMRMRVKPVARARDPQFLTVDNINPVLMSRLVSPTILASTYSSHKAFYDRIGREAPREDATSVKASLILISGCEDHQASADIGFNGLFTWMLKKVWENGNFDGDHEKFYREIKNRVLASNDDQSPKLSTLGTNYAAFLRQNPYKVE
jgi:hypothetical protein